MKNYDYSKTASKYEEKMTSFQKSASGKLLKLLKIKSTDNVLDLGCGPGNVTSLIRNFTSSRILGVDPYEGMINEALKNYSNKNIEFIVNPAENICYSNEFNIVFCTSAFHWFKNPQVVINNCYDALRIKGKIGIQCGATHNCAPLLYKGIEHIKNDPRIKPFFMHFITPWFFLDTTEEYTEFFESGGFNVTYVEIISEHNEFTLQKMLDYIKVAAAPGFLNQENYSIKIDDNYIKLFLELLKKYYEKAFDGGTLDFEAKRLFLIAEKI